MAKKIGKLLGLEEPQFLAHPDGDRVFQNSLPFDVEPVAESVKNNKIEKSVVVAPNESIINTEKKEDKAVTQSIKKKVTLGNIQSGKEGFISRVSLPLSAGSVKWILLGLVAAGLFVTRNEIIDLLIGQQTPTAAVVPAEPIEPLPEVSQASLPVVLPPLPSEASCPKADPTVSEYRVLEPTKTADFIFVQSKAKQTICVIDLAGKSNMQMMDVGSNYTFTGQAPFTVLTNGISQVSIYFQGRPVRIQGDAIRTIRLLEAK